MNASDKSILVTDIPGYTPHISRLICMMNYARYITLNLVKDLTTKELDHLIDKESNSIGALLMHLAAVEYFYQVASFEEREPTKAELSQWRAGLDLGEAGRIEIKGNDLEYYIGKMNALRKRTLELFKERDDKWLQDEFPFWENKPSNNYFLWFHVFEDEINHRGQISWIKKRLRKSIVA
ncbi:MAG: DinB family protein [Ignavibacteria bacterium]